MKRTVIAYASGGVLPGEPSEALTKASARAVEGVVLGRYADGRWIPAQPWQDPIESIVVAERTAEAIRDGRIYRAVVRSGEIQVYRDGQHLCAGPWKGTIVHGRGRAPESVWEELDRLLNEQQDE